MAEIGCSALVELAAPRIRQSWWFRWLGTATASEIRIPGIQRSKFFYLWLVLEVHYLRFRWMLAPEQPQVVGQQLWIPMTFLPAVLPQLLQQGLCHPSVQLPKHPLLQL